MVALRPSPFGPQDEHPDVVTVAGYRLGRGPPATRPCRLRRILPVRLV